MGFYRLSNVLPSRYTTEKGNMGVPGTLSLTHSLFFSVSTYLYPTLFDLTTSSHFLMSCSVIWLAFAGTPAPKRDKFHTKPWVGVQPPRP